MPGRPAASPPRYAVYFAPPPGSDLDRFGSRWLGRDAWTDTALEQPPVDGIDAGRLADLTASPRRYGFHATLKAPFALRGGTTVVQLVDALAAFAAARPPVRAGRLVPSRLGSFLALTLARPSSGVGALADACTESFHPFAAPLSAADRDRRRAGLSNRQRALLDRWHYPYVFEEYRFHMTLTGPVEDGDADHLQRAVADLAAGAIRDPLVIDAITLFMEEEPGARFRTIERFALTGTAPTSY